MTDATLENARNAWNATVARVESAAAKNDLAEIAETGTLLAHVAATGEGFLGTMPNVMAALLEYVRGVYVDVKGGTWVATPTALSIPDGTYTLSDDGETFYTIRVRSISDGNFAGKRLAEYLAGPDNGTDFRAFAFVTDSYVHVWRRYMNSAKMSERADLLERVARAGDLESAGLAYAETSKRCRRCNRELTVPASIGSGYGPDCAARLGVPYGDVRLADVA